MCCANPVIRVNLMVDSIETRVKDNPSTCDLQAFRNRSGQPSRSAATSLAEADLGAAGETRLFPADVKAAFKLYASSMAHVRQQMFWRKLALAQQHILKVLDPLRSLARNHPWLDPEAVAGPAAESKSGCGLRV
jgi:hypothetical protein